MEDIINEYVESNFIQAEHLSELAENMTSYEVQELWDTVVSMGLRTDADIEDLYKYRGLDVDRDE